MTVLLDWMQLVYEAAEMRAVDAWAIEEGVPAPVLTAALYERFSSRDLGDFADRALSAMRNEFGGHEEKPEGSS